ncbi:hypothetical protein Tco_0454788 [Tanacetum coccineum]
MVRFGKKGKLAPRYVGPFEIVECVLREPPDVQVALDEIEIDRKTVICSKNLLRSVERIVKKLKRNESQWSNERLELLRQRT